MAALKDISKKIALGIGVIDIKVNHIETADDLSKKHTPYVATERDGDTVTITVEVGHYLAHPNLPDHWIDLIEIYAADGRHVDTLAKGDMAAGTHSLTWSLQKDVPSGVYFYKVMSGSNQSTGKITRVD